MCCYFDYIINGIKINFSNILLNKKYLKNILIYNISYKSPAGPKPLHLGWTKQINFLYLLMIKLNTQYYLIKGCLI